MLKLSRKLVEALKQLPLPPKQSHENHLFFIYFYPQGILGGPLTNMCRIFFISSAKIFYNLIMVNISFFQTINSNWVKSIFLALKCPN